MFKTLVIFGTRPEAIKLAPVVLALRRAPEIFGVRVCVTAQHRQMLDQALDAFGIAPDTDLDLMRDNQTLGALTARAIEALDRHVAQEKPALVIAQGDTTTVLCAALAAFYNRIPLAHVEAGLRTGNLEAPWPEEANRVLASRLATLHFAPTEGARQNLLKEGTPGERIFVTGNTAIDALFLALDRVKARPPEIPGLPAPLATAWDGAPVVLITGHRRESFGPGFETICQACAELAARFPRVQFVYPVHLNPNVREPVRRILGGGGSSARGNIHLLEPLPYLSFVALLERATLILTDSGGVQEEAPSLGKPVLVLRETTERPEAVAAGTAKLVGANRELIVRETARLLTEPAYYRSMSRAPGKNPFGDGHAAERIVAACRTFLEGHGPGQGRLHG